MSTTTLATSGLSAPASGLESALITGFFIILAVVSVPASWVLIHKTRYAAQATNLMALEIGIYSLLIGSWMADLYNAPGLLLYIIPLVGAMVAILITVRICGYIMAHSEGDEGRVVVDTDKVLAAIRRDALQVFLILAVAAAAGVTVGLLAHHASSQIARYQILLGVGAGLIIGLIPLAFCLHFNDRRRRAEELAAEAKRREDDAKAMGAEQAMDAIDQRNKLDDNNAFVQSAIDQGTFPLPADLSDDQRRFLEQYPIGHDYIRGAYRRG